MLFQKKKTTSLRVGGIIQIQEVDLVITRPTEKGAAGSNGNIAVVKKFN